MLNIVYLCKEKTISLKTLLIFLVSTVLVAVGTAHCKVFVHDNLVALQNIHVLYYNYNMHLLCDVLFITFDLLFHVVVDFREADSN